MKVHEMDRSCIVVSNLSPLQTLPPFDLLQHLIHRHGIAAVSLQHVKVPTLTRVGAADGQLDDVGGCRPAERKVGATKRVMRGKNGLTTSVCMSRIESGVLVANAWESPMSPGLTAMAVMFFNFGSFAVKIISHHVNR